MSEKIIKQLTDLIDHTKALEKIHGQVPRDDKELWYMLDNLLPGSVKILDEYAQKSRWYKAPTKLWVTVKLKEIPFKLRQPDEKYKKCAANNNIWTMYRNGIEQLEKALNEQAA
jgi:hypothetical protein